MSAPVCERLLVVGLGLIGGSLALAAKASGGCREVIGVARSESTRQAALALGVADHVYADVASACEHLSAGDIVLVATPTLTVEAIFRQLQPVLPAGVTLTDAASVKGSVVTAAEAVFDTVPGWLVPGHPIAGSEQSGVSAAREELFQQHRCILTPLPQTEPVHLDRVRRLWESAGADVTEMGVAEHDAVLAATSHLPHVLAYALVDTLAKDSAQDNIFRYAAGGFRDFTRIASSDPLMWHDIALANRDALVAALDRFSAHLYQLRDAVERGDGEQLLAVFSAAKATRDRFAQRFSQPPAGDAGTPEGAEQGSDDD